MKKPSKEQQKIISITLIGLFSLIIFLMFVYMPQHRKLSSIKKQLADTESQIAQIKSLYQDRDLANTVKALETELRDAAVKLPPQSEDVISGLSELERSEKVKILNLDPLDEIPLGDKIEGCNVFELPINISLVGEFRSIGEFLQKVKENFAYLARVKEMNIKGRGEGQKNLTVSLNLSVYLARKK